MITPIPPILPSSPIFEREKKEESEKRRKKDRRKKERRSTNRRSTDRRKKNRRSKDRNRKYKNRKEFKKRRNFETTAFKTDAELFEWLLSGKKIASRDVVCDYGYIHLVDGIKMYENGEDACGCLISYKYWERLF